jgi:hypothetical protein
MLDRRIAWSGAAQVNGINYTCGFCSGRTAPPTSFRGEAWKPKTTDRIHVVAAICTACGWLTLVWDGGQHPEALPGRTIEALPSDVGTIYAEARLAFQSSAYTGTVLLLRTMLMHIAAEKGMPKVKDANFQTALEYLITNGDLATSWKPFVDKLRIAGNDATHKLEIADANAAKQIMAIAEFTLIAIYEQPARLAGGP